MTLAWIIWAGFRTMERRGGFGPACRWMRDTVTVYRAFRPFTEYALAC